MRLVIQVLAFLLLTVPVKLIENAILGWGDDLIAKSLGITSPTLADVATFAWRWGIPLLTLALLFWWYNVSYSRKANAITVGSAQPVWVQAVLPGLITLPDAARRVYEKFRHKPLGNYIDRNFGGDTDQMLNVLAGHIAGTTVVLLDFHRRLEGHHDAHDLQCRAGGDVRFSDRDVVARREDQNSWICIHLLPQEKRLALTAEDADTRRAQHVGVPF